MAPIPVKRLAAFVAMIALVGPMSTRPAKAGRYVPSRYLLLAQDRDDDNQAAPRSRTSLTFLQLNDVYSLTPLDGVGGLARIATLKQRVAAEGRTALLVLAGDFLGPSVASSVFQGEQTVAALNAAGLDIATLGNHEFDFGRDTLIKRMSESQFTWVVSNVIDRNTGKPIGTAVPYFVKEIGNVKVGFIGLCLTTSEIAPDKLTGIRLVNPLEAAAQYLPVLKRLGANVVVAVTHLAFEDDRALVDRFPAIDIVIGGHEHYPIAATENRTLISKSGSDGKAVARIDVGRRPSGVVEKFYELLPITSALPDDPKTAAVVKAYEDRLGKELEIVVGSSAVPLDGDEVHVRTGETNLGNLVADIIRAHVGADVAIVNAGSVRGERIIPPGPLDRRTLIGIHPFGDVITKVAVPGRVLLQALKNGVSRWPSASGRFPQISGMTMIVDTTAPANDRVRDVRIGGEPLDASRMYTVALPDYVLKGGDDYTMFGGQKVLVSPESGDLLLGVMEQYAGAHPNLAPAIDGRIRLMR
jgi:5'-nucleotidase